MVLETALMIIFMVSSLIQSGISNDQMARDEFVNDIYNESMEKLNAALAEKEVNLTQMTRDLREEATKIGMDYDKLVGVANAMYNNYTTGGSKQELYQQIRGLEDKKLDNQKKQDQVEIDRTEAQKQYTLDSAKAKEDAQNTKRSFGKTLEGIFTGGS